MIADKAMGLITPPPIQQRRRHNTVRFTLATPTPTLSAPNIIELAANMQQSGKLLDTVLEKPSASKPKAKLTKRPPPVSTKGKERAPQGSIWDDPESEASSIADEREMSEEMESEEAILER